MTVFRGRAGRLTTIALGSMLALTVLASQAMSIPTDQDGSSRLSDTQAQQLAEREAQLGRSESTGQAGYLVDKDAEGNPYVAGELIVTYKEQAPDAIEKAALTEVQVKSKDNVPEIDTRVVSVPEVKQEQSREVREDRLERKKRELKSEPGVETVDYNYLSKKLAAPNDPLYGQQWGLKRIKASQAWNTARGAGSVIAIIDGGAQSTHPDLNGAVVDEWDYYNGDPYADDEDGHGTHVSGIAAAYTNEGSGIAGTAPDAPLFNYDVCGATSCPTSYTISAIMDATDLGADVINMSLGGYGYSSAEENAVNYAWNRGVVIVSAAGNDATNTRSYPAAFPNVIAVSGTDYYNRDSDFSNYGSWVDVAAPGGDDYAPYSERILSSVPTYIAPSGYDAWNGTSMASPFVAGVAALLDSQGLSNSQVRNRIQSSATDLGTNGPDTFFGYGLVNAQAAVDLVRPRGTAIINGGRISTSSRSVTLKLSANDPSPGTGVASMRFRNAGGSWSSWQKYATTKSWRLTTGTGIKTVYVQYRDRAGNASASAQDSIRYRP